MNFANNFLCARTSEAYALTRSGLYSKAAINALVLSDRGLSVYDAADNLIRNPKFVGALAGTPGTLPNLASVLLPGSNNLTRSVLTQVDSDGIPMLGIRLVGTPAATGFGNIVFGSANHYPAVMGETVTAAAEVWTVDNADAMSVYVAVQGYASNGGTLTENSTTVITNQRYKMSSHKRTLTSATTVYAMPHIRFALYADTTYDTTIWIKAPLWTKLGFLYPGPILPATSDIMASTKAADNVTTLMGSGSAPFPGWTERGLGAGFSFAGSIARSDFGTGAQRTIFEISDGSPAKSVRLYIDTDERLTLQVMSGGSVLSTATCPTAASTAGRHMFAGDVSASGLILVQNAGLIEAAMGPAITMPTGFNMTKVGSRSAGDRYLNAVLEQLYFGASTNDLAPLQNWVATH